MSGLDDLEAQAEQRRRTRTPPPPRNPHGTKANVQPSAAGLASLTAESVARALPAPHEPTASTPTLAAAERNELGRCETALRAADVAFWVRGRMFQTIRDARLYRETHATFEEYCLQTWQRTARRVNQFIEAWPLAERLLLELGTIVPKINEGQVRALLPLADEHGDAAAVYLYRALAQADVQVTAEVIKAVIRLLPVGPWDDANADKAVAAYLDGPRVLPAANRREQPDQWATTLAQITKGVDRLAAAAADDPERARTIADSLEAAAVKIRARLPRGE